MAPVLDLTFPCAWKAQILTSRPLILPQRHYIYPRDAEEVERGALELLITPLPFLAKGTGFSPYIDSTDNVRSLALEEYLGAPGLDSETGDQPFLATCALGFRDPILPTGLWSTPNPKEICAVSGGYAYLIDTTAPHHFTMIPYRPVLDIRPVPAEHLLLFVGHHSILAWGPARLAWESDKLSDEGVTITTIEGGLLRGLGWNLMSDTETPFALDPRTGRRSSSDGHA